MPVIIVPEILGLLPLRFGDSVHWTAQPGGGPDMHVGDLMEASEVAEASITKVQREAVALETGAPRIEARILRPYQNDCVEAVFEAWRSGKKAPLIILATGAGKSLISAEIIRRLREQHPGFGFRVWFLAHRRKLLTQMYKHVKLIAPEAMCGLVQGTKNDIAKFLTIASVDTLAVRRRFDDAIDGNGDLGMTARAPSVVIIDEAHRATSDRYKRVIEWARAANPDCVFLGQTATPGRTDGTALDKVFDHVAYERNAFQLIADGYLVPPVGFRVNLNVDLNVVPTENGEFKKAPLSKVMNQPAVNHEVVEGYRQFGDGRKLLAFCVDVKHAHDLAECFRQEGINARAVDGAMKTVEQDALLQSFAEGKIRILCSCDILTEGYDDPSAQGVLFARPTKSQLVYIQILGRALRLYPGKSDALVLDCVGNSHHPIAQLASLAGLDKIVGDSRAGGAPNEETLEQAEVGGLEGTAIDFSLLKSRTSRWAWRETRFGWAVSIPRIGYFLLAWVSNDRSTVDVRFHDMRAGHADTPPKTLSAGMDFGLAHGLVEREIERLFSARSARALAKSRSKYRKDGSEETELEDTREALDSGMSGELFSPEDMMRQDANWRERDTSAKQRTLLVDIGVKPESIPEKSGEASDLLTVMTIERNAKMREPATKKQRDFIIRHRLVPTEELETMTKKRAQGLVIGRLKELEAKKHAGERFAAEDEAPLFEQEDT